MNSLGQLKAWFIKLVINNYLALLPLFFPLYLVKLEWFNLPFNVLELVILLTFLVWIVLKLLKIGQNFRQIKAKKNFLKQLFLRNWQFLVYSCLFLLIALMAVLIVPQQTFLIDGQTIYESKKIALGIFKGWIVLPYLYFVMLWFSTKSSIDNKSLLFKSIYAYVFSALPLVIWAFYQYSSGHFITADGRASGPFINANYLAMYLAPAIVALWILIVRGILLGFKLPKFLIGAFLAVFYSIVLLMTQSYGAMLAVLGSLSFFFIATWILHKQFKKEFELNLLKKISYFLLTICLVIFLAAGLLFIKTEKWKLLTEFNSRSSSAVRLEVYDIAWSLIYQNPLRGIGFGQFEPLYNLKAPEILGHAPYEWVMIHPHNTLLAIWLNLGVGGLIIFLGLILTIFKKYWQSASYEDKFYRLIGLSMLLVILLHGMVDTYLFKNDLAMLFWLIIALCLLPKQLIVEGLVVEGAKLGKTIGFPTANLQIKKANFDLADLKFGVYGVRIWLNEAKYLGALSYGTRPTVDNSPHATFEVFIVDFDENIYGQTLKVEIAWWVRSILKFKNLEELKSNINHDLKLIKSEITI